MLGWEASKLRIADDWFVWPLVELINMIHVRPRQRPIEAAIII